jgi:hypothetical protein
MRTIGILALATLVLSGSQGPVAPRGAEPGAQALEKAFLEHGIHLDVARGLCSIPVTIDVRDDLLEYLLVNPQGAQHESLFLTDVVPSRLNAALLALGAERGKNAEWKLKDPAPTPEEVRDGVLPYTVDSPTGDGFLLYVAWREQGETFFFRVDDLLRNLETGRSLVRHRWVFLGSRMVRFRGQNEQEVFAADVEGNLVNIVFFEQGNTLLTGARPECLRQTIWLANGWLLPSRGSPVQLFFSRQPLAALPEGVEARLPVVPKEEEPDGGRER